MTRYASTSDRVIQFVINQFDKVTKINKNYAFKQELNMEMFFWKMTQVKIRIAV